MASSLGALSSLGLGSKGALSYTTIDKLKKADEASIITPIDDKITADKSKEAALDKLTTLLATLKGSTSALSYDTIYSQTSVTADGTSASATAQSGVSNQTITLNVNNIATNDIQESKSFASATSTFTSSNDTLKFALQGGSSFSVNVGATTTISDLAQSINNNSNGTISASILNVGGTNPYKLVIKSTATGASNAITVSSTGGGSAASDLNLTTVGNGAQDASFTYNGISVSRSSNDITDLITGVDIKLLSSGSTTIKISQDTKSLSDEVNSFITNYNNLIDNLNTTTSYNTETKKAGIFQGVSQIRDIQSSLNNQIFSFNVDGKFLSDFGITQNSAGHLQLDNATFQSALNTNPQSIKDFFEGGTTNNPNDGLFVTLNNNLQSIFMNQNSEIPLYKSYLDTNLKNLNNQKTQQTQRLTDKYNILAKKFAAYDSIIANFNQASQSLQMQISSFINTKG